MLKFSENFEFSGENSNFERIRMVRMVRMVRSLADRTFQPRPGALRRGHPRGGLARVARGFPGGRFPWRGGDAARGSLFSRLPKIWRKPERIETILTKQR